MSITLCRRQLTLLFLLALVMLFVLSPMLLNAVAPVHVWLVMLSTLKVAIPSFMFGG